MPTWANGPARNAWGGSLEEEMEEKEKEEKEEEVEEEKEEEEEEEEVAGEGVV